MQYFILFFWLFLPLSAQAAAPSVYLEEMTSEEVAQALGDKRTTVIVPTGGTEQNGAHLALGKHNRIVKYTSGEIAKRLGDAIAAPVIAYVPEGRIAPPEGHMHFAGTLSVSEETFEDILEDTARSLKQHGFTLICFIGDSGGNQEGQANVAEKLSREWKKDGVKVLHIEDYYDSKKNGQDAWLASQGFSPEDIGIHAGIADSSELMTIDASLIRTNKLADNQQSNFAITGATGDSRKASTKIGKQLLELKIDAAIKQIRAIIAESRQ